jgi:hypothetical protein
MTALLKVQTEMWEFTVIPGKFIKAAPTEENRYAFDCIRIYADIHNFGRDFGDYDEFETIKKMWEGEVA